MKDSEIRKQFSFNQNLVHRLIIRRRVRQTVFIALRRKPFQVEIGIRLLDRSTYLGEKIIDRFNLRK